METVETPEFRTRQKSQGDAQQLKSTWYDFRLLSRGGRESGTPYTGAFASRLVTGLPNATYKSDRALFFLYHSTPKIKMGGSGSKTEKEEVTVKTVGETTGTISSVTLDYFLESAGLEVGQVMALNQWANDRDAVGLYQQHLSQAREVLGEARLRAILDPKRLSRMLGERRYQNPLLQVTIATPLVVMLAALLSAIKEDSVLVQGYLGRDSWHRKLIAGPASDVNAPEPPVDIVAIVPCTAAPAVLRTYDPYSGEEITRLEFLVRLAATLAKAVRKERSEESVRDMTLEAEKAEVARVCREHFAEMEERMMSE